VPNLLFTAIKAFALASYLVLAFLALRSSARRQVRLFFSIYLFGMLAWQSGSLAVSFTAAPENALALYNLMIASSGAYTILFFAFTRALLGIKRQKALVVLSYVAVAVQVVASGAGLQFRSVILGKGGYWVPVYSEGLMYALSAVSFTFWGLGFWNLVRGYAREKSPVQRNRVIHIIFGAAITIIGASTNLIGLRDYPVDISANLVSALIIGNAVVRHRLTDLRLILAKSLFYFLLTVTLVAIYLGVVTSVEGLVQESLGYSGSLQGAFALIILAVVFLPVQKGLQGLIDRVFFRQRGDYQRGIQAFSGKIGALYAEEEVLSLACAAVRMSVKPTFVSILLRDPKRNVMRSMKTLAEPDAEEGYLELQEDSALAGWLASEAKPIVREESLLDPETRHLVESATGLFASRNTAVIVPVLIENRLLGLLALGQKRSGAMYNDEDLGFLATIANQTAAALDKTEIFRRIQRRLDEQTLLFVLSEQFRSPADFDEIMDSVVETLTVFLNFDLCILVCRARGGTRRSFARNEGGRVVGDLVIRAWEAIAAGDEGHALSDEELAASTQALASETEGITDEGRRALGALTFLTLVDGERTIGFLGLPARAFGSGPGGEHGSELARTIRAIVSQGIVLRRTLADLGNLEAYNEKILDSLNDMGDTLIILDDRGRVIRVNKATCRLLDYAEGELVGREVGEILWDGGGPLSPEGIQELLARQVISNRELSYRTKSGARVPMLFSGSVLRVDEGERREIIGIARDMTERLEAEEAAKNLLLVREVHHRIKNNLQVISSLLNLQAGYVQDEAVKEMFRESQNRVRSMALIHEKLYRSQSASTMDFGGYVDDLARNLMSSYSLRPSRVKLEVEVAEVNLEMDAAVPCSLIINELVSNAFKHAFPDDRGGTIAVRMRPVRQGEAKGVTDYELIVEDDGVGFPAGLDFESSGSLGLRIVHTLTGQLRGEMRVAREGGTRFTLMFPARH